MAELSVAAPPVPKTLVKLSLFGSAGAAEKSLLKSAACCALGASDAAVAGALNSLVNAPGSLAVGVNAGDAANAGAGVALNIEVNSPGAGFGAGSGLAELSRSGKLKILANSSGEAALVAGCAFAVAAD
ncbi:MAG: hypothetical protein ABSD13_10170 [Candidatus Korobacteraceae bacterium]